MLNDVLSTIDNRREASLAALKDFLRIPSVSTKPDHAADMLRCATWVADHLKMAGLTAQVRSTPGHPIVVARNKHQPGRPTVLFYGHYDVQPPEPLDLWTTPAFEPTIRKTRAGSEAIYARGAVDDKGQVWCHLEAITAWQAHGGLPVNLVALIEGEEEIGSHHLESFINDNLAELKADIAVISDTGQFDRGHPAITYGLRGLVYMEVFLTGPSSDLHSGMFGGAVTNPANAAARLIASLHDPVSGRVTIPGFYDDVIELRDEERAMWRALPFSEDEYLRSLGVDVAPGEQAYSILERRWARPTCDVNGITTGYQGPGAKTVIPSKASFKVSMRLVPGQDPAKIQKAFIEAMKDRCPRGIKLEFSTHGASPAVLVLFDSRAAKLAADAVEVGFARKPTFIREGGSIPVVGLIKKALGIDTLLVGFGLPDDQVHAPDEKFDLDALFAGTRTAAALYDKLAGL